MKTEMAYLKNVKLYRDRSIRAATVPGQEGEITKGWVLSNDDPEVWKQKLERFDEREGYHGPESKWNSYVRTEHEAYIFDNEAAWNSVTSIEDIENKHSSKRTVYLYKMDDCTKDDPMEGGDWLKRHIDLENGLM